jgi:hypothetical protein
VIAEPFRRYMHAAAVEKRRNVHYDFVWADMRIEQMPALASELVARKGHAADSNRRIVIIHLGESHPTRA